MRLANVSATSGRAWIDEALDEIKSLTTRLEAAEKDSERLDALMKAKAIVCRDDDEGGWYLYWHTSNRMSDTYPTQRAAIDAAIAKEKS